MAPGSAPLAGLPPTSGWQAQRAPAGPGIRAAAHGRGHRGVVLPHVRFAARLGPGRPYCERPGSDTDSELSDCGGLRGVPLPRPAGAGGRRRPPGPDTAGDILRRQGGPRLLIAAGRAPDPYHGGAYPGGQAFLTPAPGPRLSLRNHSEGRLERFALLASARAPGRGIHQPRGDGPPEFLIRPARG